LPPPVFVVCWSIPPSLHKSSIKPNQTKQNQIKTPKNTKTPKLRDDLLSMLVAGHETTGSALTWTLYLLASNPDTMAAAQAEVDAVLGPDGVPTLEQYSKLAYVTRAVCESMRLYPHPPVLLRRARVADTLPGGYEVAAGQDVMISVYNIHHSPLVWEDAEAFKPDRFPLDGPVPNEQNTDYRCSAGGGARGGCFLCGCLPAHSVSCSCSHKPSQSPPSQQQHAKNSYVPFSGGPRKCIGDQFALMEAVAALAVLLRRFDFKLVPGQTINMTTGATIHTTDGLYMTVSKRGGSGSGSGSSGKAAAAPAVAAA
jgi:carotene epsilon-monooxygenase